MGKPTVLAFIDMIAGGSLLMIISFAMAWLLPLRSIRYFSLADSIVGAYIIVLAFFLSEAYTYIVTDEELRKKYRFFASSTETVPLREVTNIIVVQDFFGRLLGFSTIRADTAGTAYTGIVFKGLKNPDEAFKTISEARNAADKPVEDP
jgi:uncharacterized membrane protein YdbT with pleckstrin-like domain